MKDIPGFERLYAVTEDGRVWSYPKVVKNGRKYARATSYGGRFLNPTVFSCGYFYVGLNAPNKKKKGRVHRLVAMAFIPNPLNLTQVNHKNGNKLDNRVENLEWCTHKQNMKHGARLGLFPKGEKVYNHKLSEKDVRKILKSDISDRELAKQYKVHWSTIHYIRVKRLWKHI